MTFRKTKAAWNTMADKLLNIGRDTVLLTGNLVIILKNGKKCDKLKYAILSINSTGTQFSKHENHII